jgi:hypothetical protein
MPEDHEARAGRTSKRPWEPMKLSYLGDVVQLVLQGEPPGKGFSPPADSAGGGKKGRGAPG